MIMIVLHRNTSNLKQQNVKHRKSCQPTSYHEKETTFSKNFLRWNLQKIFHPLEQTMTIQGKHAKQSAVFEASLIVLKHYMDLNLRNNGSFVWYFIVHLLCFLSQLKNTLKQIL
jgi:hypothetical protein